MKIKTSLRRNVEKSISRKRYFYLFVYLGVFISAIKLPRIPIYLLKLSSLSSSDFGIIILPEYLPEEEKEARKEILRLKRMLKKTFPDILVTSNLRLNAKTWNEMVRKRKKEKDKN